MKTKSREFAQSSDRYNGVGIGVVGAIAVTAIAGASIVGVKEQNASVSAYEYHYLMGGGCLDETTYDKNRAEISTNTEEGYTELSVNPTDDSEVLRFSYVANEAGRMALTPADELTQAVLIEHNC